MDARNLSGKVTLDHCVIASSDLDRTDAFYQAVFGAEVQKPMSLFRQGAPGTGRTPGVLADVARIETIWRETRTRFGAGGPFLFGRAFTLADAMYAPVVARLRTYAPELAADSQAYCAAVRTHPLVAEWYDAAAAEPAEWHLPSYENAP